MTIKVNDSWAKLQYAKALDNPVEKALRSGKPSFINFGATGCIPCEMMAPIREEIKKEYAGKLNVEFINVRENQIMGSRYGISSIPTQVFYDKDGKEVYRHTGFWAKEKVVEKISELGVKK
ncbi:thioredoxin family protein [Candidatus Poribacteria bacterium]|nr:thioredoxin family protein [Candidatus Poribacteria bacterium]